MLNQGFPITARLPEEFGLGERFWYWRGASGRNYIHSIYPADLFPPLPGAVYLAVRRNGELRHAEAIGRFPSFWDSTMGSLAASINSLRRADELHVHLLARNDEAAKAVLCDLSLALDDYLPHSGNHGEFEQDERLALAAA